MDMIFVGIDVSKDRLDVHVLPDTMAFAVSRDGKLAASTVRYKSAVGRPCSESESDKRDFAINGMAAELGRREILIPSQRAVRPIRAAVVEVVFFFVVMVATTPDDTLLISVHALTVIRMDGHDFTGRCHHQRRRSGTRLPRVTN